MMKKANIILIITLILSFFIGVLGAILKIFWAKNAEVLLLASLIMLPLAVIGLVVSNLGKIKDALR